VFSVDAADKVELEAQVLTNPGRTPLRWCGAAVLCAVLLATFVAEAGAQVRRVNAPHFPDAARPAEAAVFWFGRVDPAHNYTDVRIAYTNTEVWVRLSTFDQWLWLDESASRTPGSLETWDAATVVLDTNGSAQGAPSSSSFRFVGELGSWRPRTDYQAAYIGAGSTWTHAPQLPFTTETIWRGDTPNNAGPDRGWVITFRIPFSSLGLSGPPAAGTIWRLGAQVHDRDAPAAPAVTETWPEGLGRDRTETWGQLGFGLRPQPTSPVPPGAETFTIRHGLNGLVVRDAMVGGGSTCGDGLDFFTQWGAANHARSTHLVVQNQGDIADWPCFSKFFVDFPLSSLPAGKAIVAATLTVYQFGNSDPSQAQRSLVQVSTISEAWNEDTVTWNTAPLALENVAQASVNPIQPPGVPWPGAARTWNLTWSTSQAYSVGQPTLRLVFYSADGAYHSGKYFTSAETGDWNAVGRPTLEIVLGEASTTLPSAPRNFRVTRPD
jgi:hypothetical protein